ncbi:MAG: translation initiation factor IF-3 [Porphyrobacter sp.]|nr:translation initiation factor IF-3 [Porphyrobacter sp.]
MAPPIKSGPRYDNFIQVPKVRVIDDEGQKTQDIKEVKMRPNIDTHDYDVKMRNVNKFIEHGDKVKITLRFRGREMAHQHLGMDLLKKVQEDVAEVAKVEAFPRLEGRQMLMVLAPK